MSDNLNIFPAGHCSICGKPRPNGSKSTCGASECQEADYHANKARNARRARSRR